MVMNVHFPTLSHKYRIVRQQHIMTWTNIDAINFLAFTYPLSNLAQVIGLAGSLLGGRSSGKSIVSGIGRMRSGTYVAGAGELISGTASGVMTGAGASVGSDQIKISIPTSPPEAIAEVLKGTANLGSFVAKKVGQWLKANELFNARIRFFQQKLTATPYEIWECKGNKWVCVEKVYEITISNLQRGIQLKKGGFKLDSDFARDGFKREINRMERMAKGRLVEGVRRRLQFVQKHQRGPCGS